MLILNDMVLTIAFIVVWVPDANLLAVDTSGNGLTTVEQPDQTLKSLDEFIPEEWGLPPYESEPDVD